ncbi:MAG: F0F1 ATP synthase subunit B [Clostridia bacterium]|nr:F0F1 ATP synthase subunit B [Clostridia bacterium]
MGFEVFTDKFESFIGTNFWTMIIAWINLLIVFLILRKLLFKPVKNMIDSRQKEIDDLYADAQQSRDDAAAMKADYESKLENATEKSEEILKASLRKAQLKEEEILKEAEEKAARTLARAEEQIEMEKKQAISDIKNEVSDMAVEIAAAVLSRDIDKDEHAQLIDDFIENFGENND